MMVLVTKASDDYWYEVKVFNSMEDIQQFIEENECRIIIKRNQYIVDEMFEFWHGMKTEDIPTIKKCSLHITIYDYYVE